MGATIILGGQWGDEGKGKLTDALATQAQLVVRANGGSNAGHTLETPYGVFKMHLIPSGILNPACACVIGAGVVVDPFALTKELDDLQSRGIDTSNLMISDRAHLVLPVHPLIDRLEEQARNSDPIGTTLRGIGPAYADKVSRRGVRVGDLLEPNTLRAKIDDLVSAKNQIVTAISDEDPVEANGLVSALIEIGERLAHHIGPAEITVQDALDRGDEVLVECAQGALLDIDYGTYPYVTSSSPTAAGALQGAGIAPTQVSRVIAVFKAYSTRVGSGPMPTELLDGDGELIRERGREYGTTTGRPRRTGWFDAVAARYTSRLNGVSEIALSLLDVLDAFETIKVCTAYRHGSTQLHHPPGQADLFASVKPEYQTLPGWLADITAARTQGDLPAEALAYAESLGRLVGAPVTMVGVGPAREQLVPLSDKAAIVGRSPASLTVS
jgi:adenylosuccinate synthase